MTRPTREQIEVARGVAARIVDANCVAVASPTEVKEAFATLLAATAEPTEEELREEAGRWAGIEGHGASGRAARAGYIAGAGREGAR